MNDFFFFYMVVEVDMYFLFKMRKWWGFKMQSDLELEDHVSSLRRESASM